MAAAAGVAGDAAQITGEAVGIGHVAQHVGLLEPVRFALATLVEQPQLRRPGGVAGGYEGQQAITPGVEVGPVAVEQAQRPHRVGPVELGPRAEDVAFQRRQRAQRPRRQGRELFTQP